MQPPVNEFIREIEEELSRDRALRFWRQYGRWFAGAAVLLVLAVAANSAWQGYRRTQAETLGERYLAAGALVDAKDFAKAAEAFKAVAGDGEGYPQLARFRQADALIRAGKREEALTLYAELSRSAREESWRDLAVLARSTLLLDAGPLPEDAATALRAAAADGRPLHGNAKELLALNALVSGDRAAALKEFGGLADTATAPQSATQRARDLRDYFKSRETKP